ncbi:hypothetical protein COCON_G00073200 [Conger conger]|uniref:Uncharacterized protein n=1 Tax=Conger conger TaxID=82655 RepID=A0A9Q1DN78_CONCO|nr:hypothetical protein COCON_G00073200 [Conger conger]
MHLVLQAIACACCSRARCDAVCVSVLSVRARWVPENEWRTRFETQQELNGQLEQQICLVREKLEDLRGNPDDRLSSIRVYDAMPVDALKRILEQLTRDKASLQNQLTDCSLRIAQEAKAYQKANEDRRAYQAEISKAVPALVPGRRLQQMARPQEGKDSRIKRISEDAAVRF